MRNKFASVVTELAHMRDDICLLSGDIGNRMFDEFKKVAGERFINCGIAEANMMSMAAGMALSGLRPIVYTITPFTTTRCLEQIRTGVAYHEAPVVIVGTGSGLSYAELGATHHSLEDLAILRNIPKLQICAPTDSIELEAQLKEAINGNMPTYIRIGKKGEPDLMDEHCKLGIGKANLLIPGEKILIAGIGPIIGEAIKASEILKEQGINVAVAAMGSVKPFDQSFLEERIKEGITRIISLEEHHVAGGIGSTILEWLSEKEIQDIRLTRMGITDHFIHELGSQAYIRAAEEIDSSAIVRQIQSLQCY